MTAQHVTVKGVHSSRWAQHKCQEGMGALRNWAVPLLLRLRIIAFCQRLALSHTHGRPSRASASQTPVFTHNLCTCNTPPPPPTHTHTHTGSVPRYTATASDPVSVRRPLTTGFMYCWRHY